MNDYTLKKLQYNAIIEKIKNCCSSSLGSELAKRLRPLNDYKQIKQKLSETSEARNILDAFGSFGLSGTENIAEIIAYIDKDGILEISQIVQMLSFLQGSEKIKRYMHGKDIYAPYLCKIASSLLSHKELISQIESMVQNNIICNDASKELKSIRRHKLNTEEKIREKLEGFLRNKTYSKYIQESFVSRRKGRQTVPIKITCKMYVEGTVIESNKKTAFIEPASVRKLTDQLNILENEEANEEYKILCIITELLYNELFNIKRNAETLAYLDLTFAKGKFSKDIDGIEPDINNYGLIKIINGKHFLLDEFAIPLNVQIGKDFRTLIITGPNAGGKTVVLKTIGLLTLAVQAGLHVPCQKGTCISVFERIFVDIGDDQSLENALSTFSSHVKNLAYCVNKSNKSTLLLFDEIGSGTEPGEGAALAIAILEDVYKKGAITVATTHYNEIKNYSAMHPDYENAAMQFDKNTLEPQYVLQLKKSGESNALWISKKMGINNQILKKAENYMKVKDYDISPINISRIRIEEKEIEDKKYEEYTIGDRVYVNKLDKSGIVYEPKDKLNQISVYFDGYIEKLHISLLKLEVSAKQMYPDDYDMEQLFISFKRRKLEKDIKRGSKKTLKKIKKDGIEKLLD